MNKAFKYAMVTTARAIGKLIEDDKENAILWTESIEITRKMAGMYDRELAKMPVLGFKR